MKKSPLQIIQDIDVLQSSAKDLDQLRIGSEGAMMARVAVDDGLVALCPRSIGILTNLNRQIPKG